MIVMQKTNPHLILDVAGWCAVFGRAKRSDPRADGRILLTGGRESMGGPVLDTAFIIRLNPLDGMVDIVATDRMAFTRAGH